MMGQEQIEISAALALEAWRIGRIRGLILETRDRAPCVTAEGPRGERVSISCADDLFALMALANAALPASDARKITATMVEALDGQVAALGAQIEAFRNAAHRLEQLAPGDSEIFARLAEALRPSRAAIHQAAAVLRALLPQAPAAETAPHLREGSGGRGTRTPKGD